MITQRSEPLNIIEKKSSDFVVINPLTKDAELEPHPGYKIKAYGPDRPFWLYALKLSHGKYYVGYTARYNPYDRIMQHVEGAGDGAKWTELHPPLEVLEIRSIEKTSPARIRALEQNLTMEYMRIYGVNNVRGGMINYTGRVFRLGNKIHMGYLFESALLSTLVMVLGVYIFLRHYLNWW